MNSLEQDIGCLMFIPGVAALIYGCIQGISYTCDVINHALTASSAETATHAIFFGLGGAIVISAGSALKHNPTK